MNSEPQVNGSSDFHLNVCDTEFYPVREAFSAFREAVAGAFMPWQAESSSDSDFSARLTTFSTGAGSFGRTRMMAVTGIRNKADYQNPRIVASTPTTFSLANSLSSKGT